MSIIKFESSLQGLKVAELENCIEELFVLTLFVEICSKLEDREYYNKVMRDLRSLSSAKFNYVVYDGLIDSVKKVEMTDSMRNRLYDLILANFQKSKHRKKICQSIVARLIVGQSNECKICDAALEEEFCVDHIVPFAYVGDELANNYQLLCKRCNQEKGKNIFYQTRGLVRNMVVKSE